MGSRFSVCPNAQISWTMKLKAEDYLLLVLSSVKLYANFCLSFPT